MPVYKDDNRGTWFYVLNFQNEMGERKQKRKRGFKTKKAATDALKEVEVDMSRGNYVAPAKIRFSEYIYEWLKVKSVSLSKQTIKLYEINIKIHVIPSLGNLQLDQIKSMHIQRFVSVLRDKGLADSTIKRVFSIVNTCLNYAVKMGILSVNEASKIERLKVNYKKMEIWNIEQINKFLKVAEGHRYHSVFYIAIMTGLRQGELLGLRWEDVDLNRRVLHVRQILEHDGKSFKEGAKTKSSVRSIAISSSVKSLLLECKDRLDSERDYLGTDYTNLNLVMCTEKGTPIHPRNLIRAFKELSEIAGLPKIRFHDLRHTHATLMIFQNEPMKLIADRLGHSKISTTMDTYGHLLPNMQRDASDRLDQTLFG